MPNRFFIWGILDDNPWEYSPSHDVADIELRYFCGVARELDRGLGDRNMTFLITWHLDRFDDRFRDSVVLLINDEMYQLPSYAGVTRAVFKTGGTKRNPLSATLRLAPAVASRTILRELRNIGRAGRRRLTVHQTRGAPIYELPLGYFRLVDVSFVPFAQRPTDVFFAGSIESARGFTLRPRLIARRQMASALALAERDLPELKVDYTSSGPFAQPQGMLEPEAYSQRLMDARIVLCPRGNFDETFRLMEAAKSACVAVAERLPERWYYRDSPVVQIDRWSALTATLKSLLDDPCALEDRSQQMRTWWASTLSEEAVSEFVVSRLGTSLRQSARRGG